MEPIVSEREILRLRERIDEINLEILAALSRRAEVVLDIGRLQANLGLSHYDPAREERMLKALVERNPGPYPHDTIKKLFKEIFKASLDLEERQVKEALKTSRVNHPEDSVVRVGGLEIGNGEPVVIAGPCGVESWEQMDQAAAVLADLGVRIMRGGAFKPRTSPYAFQGLGEEGLKIARRAANKHGLLFCTEVLDTRDVDLVAEYADVLQVGARNMSNFALLRAVGRSSRAVMVKRGLAATIEEWLYAAEYVLNEGNPNVLLCERGIRTFEQWTRNTLDVSAIALAKLESHLPVIADVSHSAGRRDLALPLARAALAAGADGIIVEMHPNPAVALSDEKQQLDLEEFADLMRRAGLVRAKVV